MALARDDLFLRISSEIADSMEGAFLLVGTDYRIQWVSRAARDLLFQGTDDWTGLPCTQALAGKICPACCTGAVTSHEKGGLYGAACLTEPSTPPLVRNTLIRSESGTPLGLLKQILPCSALPSRPASGSRGDEVIESRGSWAETLAPILARVAGTMIPVLLIGETGTGKEVLAKRIHDLSPRRSQPLVILDLSTIPESLADDALFGHVRGSFTGAVSDYGGKLLQADGGTLFLDELENIPLPVQAKLLRFLETGIVERIGKGRGTPLDVRILAATNISPEDLLRTGRLREDLFYRLRGLTIEIPPLRARKEEIVPLIERFRSAWSDAHGLPAPSFSPALLGRFMSYAFPGNIRELRHLVDLCLTLSPSDPVTPDHLPETVERLFRREGDPFIPSAGPIGPVLSSAEREQILLTLRTCGGKILETSRSLGISRVTLWRKMKKYRLEREGTFHQ